MTEPDLWTRLRNEVVADVDPPGWDRIAGRARHRRAQRGRVLLGVTVVVVAVAAIPVITSLVRPPSGPAPSGAGPSASSVAGSTSQSLPSSASDFPQTTSTLWSVGVAGPGAGLGLLVRCRTDAQCGLELASFTLDGATVTERAVPIPFSVDDSYDLEVLGAGRAVARHLSQTGADAALLTSDSGRTWRSVPTQPSGRTDRIPDGSVLENACSDGFGECAGGPTIRVPSGALTTLSTLPSVEVRSLSQQADGSWWAWTTATASDGVPTLYRSTDDGAHWVRTALATVGQPIFSVQAARSGHTWYAAIIGELPQAKNGLLALDRSSDDGRSWTRVWRAHGAVEPRSSLGVPLVRSDSQVDIVTELAGNCYRSVDAGRTFTPNSTCAVPDWANYSRGWYLRTGEGLSVQVSPDGQTWHAIEL